MSQRAKALKVGARVRFEGRVQTLVGYTGTVVRLADEVGGTCLIQLTHLLASEDFEVLDGLVDSRPPVTTAALVGLAADAVEEVLWWERHLVEVLTGIRPDAEPGTASRPQFDPVTRTLAQRDQAKAAELTAETGRSVSARTVRRRRQRYQEGGVAGLVDGRADRHTPVFGRTDPRVLEALRKAIAQESSGSTRKGSFYLWRTREILDDEYGPGVVEMPSRSAFYRLFERATTGLHTTGSARTRRSLAKQPDREFGQLVASRPGEYVEIDSTPFDVLVLLDDGKPGRAELTGLVDLATRTIAAGVLRPTTKSVDASLLLARAVTPELMRPGWSQALSMARSVLPHRRMLELDQRLEHAAAKPTIVPETIICDHGKAFLSQNFRNACTTLRINLQPAHEDTPTDKPHIERTLESVASLFAQYVSGYVGRSAEHRGQAVEEQPLWSLPELQALLDEWIVASWQNRRHDGLRDPVTPRRMFTPNEKYAALIEVAGHVPLPLSPEDYIELLPASWRVINSYGVKIGHRIYDDPALHPFRRQPSGITAKKDLWEIHRDPYDVSQIWVRNHWDGGWITVFWKYLRSAPIPFGELAWDHTRQALTLDGSSPTEQEIATAVNDLLRRAYQGPTPDEPGRRLTAREATVAARTAATTTPSWPRPDAAPPEPADLGPDTGEDPDESVEDDLAEVVPLKIFNARKEAEQWRR